MIATLMQRLNNKELAEKIQWDPKEKKKGTNDSH